jgi:S-adenosylmethionine decarboxylase
MDVFEHFIREDGNIYVGNHLIVDMWGVINHTCHESILECFTKASEDAGATVLFKHCHNFGEGCGTTGVIVLSESHCSWHGYPEVAHLALDIFMCGSARPELALVRIKEFWQPSLVEINPLKRGKVTAQKLPAHLAQLLT